MTAPKRRRIRLPNFGIGAQVIALILVLGLVSAMAIQPTRELLAQQHRITATARELHRTERVNRRLDERISRLNDPDFIEQQARAEIGLVRPGEIAYVVMPKPHQGRQARKHKHAAKQKQHKAAPEQHGAIQGFLDFLGL
jgi:cell division protein FtsB